MLLHVSTTQRSHLQGVVTFEDIHAILRNLSVVNDKTHTSVSFQKLRQNCIKIIIHMKLAVVRPVRRELQSSYPGKELNMRTRWLAEPFWCTEIDDSVGHQFPGFNP